MTPIPDYTDPSAVLDPFKFDPYKLAVAEELDKHGPVCSIGEQGLVGQTTVHDVVVRTREFDAERTRHGRRLAVA